MGISVYTVPVLKSLGAVLPSSVVRRSRLLSRTLREDGLAFAWLWWRVQRSVRGWLTPTDAHLLYSLARRGPGEGAIVEIGSAWGKSTIILASGSKRARRERVYAIDPHTGDPWYLRSEHLSEFSSLDGFLRNLRRFRVDDWVVPVVSDSTAAAQTFDSGPIRLLYIDGLHTYEGVRADIDNWVPRVASGGLIVFDDYLSPFEDVGVRKAVDELVAAGQVEPVQQEGILVWTRKR